MQLITFLSVAATVATVSAKTAVQLNKDCKSNQPKARIINRCDYPVYIWSVFKGIGCPSDGMVTLKKGEIYQENYQAPEGGNQGVSIKVSKTQQCKGNDIVQLEYFLEQSAGKEAFWANYLDVSYVDCLDGDCPTKKEGYYLQSGSQTGAAKANADNTICPVLACSDAASCAKMSYILPDDVQTKSCDLKSDLDFYMCGSHPPNGSDDKPASSAPVPASSSKADTPAPKPSTTLKVVPSVSSANYKANVAAVTNAPEVKEPKAPKVKTNVVYVTAYETVHAKRHEHAHAHARRHQLFHA